MIDFRQACRILFPFFRSDANVTATAKQVLVITGSRHRLGEYSILVPHYVYPRPGPSGMRFATNPSEGARSYVIGTISDSLKLMAG
jgi:hypothetical protein